MFLALLPLVSATALFAPYADVTGNFQHTEYSKAGVKYFSMAFANVVCSSSTPVLGQSLTFDARLELVKSIRASGGDVIMSFGGALQDSAKDPAACGYSISKVQGFYQQFIDTYNLNFIDLDIEGAALDDRAAVEVRSRALAALKAANPELIISLTIPVAPHGMLDNALNAIRSAISVGLEYDYVNIMAMDYGSSVWEMGSAAVSASKASIKQLKDLGLKSTKLGVTAHIGKNYGDSGTFAIQDAHEFLSYCNGNRDIGFISFWELAKDFSSLEFTRLFAGAGTATISKPSSITISASSKVAVNSNPKPQITQLSSASSLPSHLTTNVCGTNWANAVSSCSKGCPAGVDRECDSGQRCYAIAGSQCNGTPAIKFNVCGANWAAAVSTCSVECPAGVDSECANGERCYNVIGSKCTAAALK